MSKSPRVIFKYKRIAEGDWQIEAHYPGAEVRYIKGFKSKPEIDEWLQGSRRIDFCRRDRHRYRAALSDLVRRPPKTPKDRA